MHRLAGALDAVGNLDRKLVLVGSLTVFTLANLVAAFTTDFTWLMLGAHRHGARLRRVHAGGERRRRRLGGRPIAGPAPSRWSLAA
jgi:hypothetical protein